MSSHLFAFGDRARTTTALAALLAAAVLIPAPAPARPSKVRSAARHDVAATPVSNPRSTRSVARLASARNKSSIALSASAAGAAIAAGIVGGLSGAMATLVLGLQRSRRRRGEHADALRRLADAASLTPRGEEHDPDAWTVAVPDHDGTAPPPPWGASDGERSPSRLPGGCPVIGYVTISGDSGSADAVRSSAAIQATCERANWNLLEIVGDRENGRILERPGLGYALGRIADGHAGGLVVSDLQRLSRSILDLGALMAWLRNADATLIALDLGINTSTVEGDRVATTLIALSSRAHERIAARTRSRLAERRANGGSNGRPAVRDRPELMERIATMRARGMTLQAIADRLNAESVPTLRGGTRWRPSSIQAALGYRRPGPRDHLPRLTRDRQ